MIRCDYCRGKITNRTPYQVIESGEDTFHFHSDQDRMNGDCAAQVAAALSAATGDRPERKPVT